MMVGKEALLYFKNGKRERVKNLRDKLIEIFIRRCSSLGHLMTREEAVKDKRLPDIEDYEAIFGTFEAFLAEAQKEWEAIFKKVTLQDGTEIWTKDVRKTLFNVAMRRALEIGHPLGLDEMFSDKKSPFPLDYIDEWGSFEAFFAGLVTEWKKKYYDEEMSEVARKAKFTREQMIEKLVQIAQRAKRLPAYNDIMTDPSGPSVAMYNSQFGNLKKAYLAAGLVDEEGNKNWELINGGEEMEEVKEMVAQGDAIGEATKEIAEEVAEEVEASKNLEISEEVEENSEAEAELVGASEFCNVETSLSEKTEQNVKLIDEWSGFVGIKLLIEFKDGSLVELAEPESGTVHLVDEKIWDMAEKIGRTTEDLVVPAIKFGGMLEIAKR